MVIGLLAVVAAVGIVYGGAGSTAVADVPDREAAIEAAEKGLPVFLGALSDLDPTRYGFKDKAELDAVVLGEPLEAYVLTPQALEEFSFKQSLAEQLEQMRRWEFPLLVEDEARTILVVTFFQGRWQAVELGGAAFAKNWQTSTAKLAEQREGKQRLLKLVKVPPIGGNFMLVETEGEELLTPLSTFGGRLPGADNLKSYAPDELVPVIADAVRQAAIDIEDNQ